MGFNPSPTRYYSNTIYLAFYIKAPHIDCADVIQLDPLFSFRPQSLDFELTTPGCRNHADSIKTKDNTMATGTVKWFNSTKGFGFIAPEGGSKDVFVHISAVERSGLTGLADDQKVTFDIEAGRDGRESAVNLALA